MVDEVYQANHGTELSDSDARPIGLRRIIIDWGFLLIPYNILIFALSGELFGGMSLVDGLVGTVALNVVFLAGPLANCYLSWLGFRSRRWTAALFIGGCLLLMLYASAIFNILISSFFVGDK